MTKKKDPKDFKKNGRPSPYKEKYIDVVYEYLEQEKGLPKLESLALILGVCTDTLRNWGKKDPRFFGALRRLELFSKVDLMDGGLTGRYNSAIVKLILSANHGMSETNKVDHTTKGEKVGIGSVFLGD